jgi:uncharacterized protein YhhL (DUF1145 family)
VNYAPVKIVCLVFYAAALVSLFTDWPPRLENVLYIGTLVMFLVHGVEVLIGFKWIRLYEGPLAVSILLTLLFGFAHWLPYKRRAEQAGSA